MTTTKYTEAREKVKAAREEARKVMEVAFNESAAELFSKHPEMQAFRWHQYTPYFNDGDSCEFGVSRDADSINILPSGDDSDWPDDPSEICCDYNYTPDAKDRFPKKKPEEMHPLHAAQASVVEFLQQFDEEDMEAMFGDHVEITAHQGGEIEKDEYEHE